MSHPVTLRGLPRMKRPILPANGVLYATAGRSYGREENRRHGYSQRGASLTGDREPQRHPTGHGLESTYARTLSHVGTDPWLAGPHSSAASPGGVPAAARDNTRGPSPTATDCLLGGAVPRARGAAAGPRRRGYGDPAAAARAGLHGHVVLALPFPAPVGADPRAPGDRADRTRAGQ